MFSTVHFNSSFKNHESFSLFSLLYLEYFNLDYSHSWSIYSNKKLFYCTLVLKSSGVCYWITHRKQYLLHYFWITPLHDLECIITHTLKQIPILMMAHVIFLLVFCMNTKTTTQSNKKPAKVTSKPSPQWFYLISIYRQKEATVAQAWPLIAGFVTCWRSAW